jgi:hypothetical protein
VDIAQHLTIRAIDEVEPAPNRRRNESVETGRPEPRSPLIPSGRYGAGVWRGEPWTPRQFGSRVSLAHSALLENPTASSNVRKPVWRHCHGAQAYKRHRC